MVSVEPVEGGGEVVGFLGPAQRHFACLRLYPIQTRE